MPEVTVGSGENKGLQTELEVPCGAHGRHAVSYTHLDVYKRQPLWLVIY